MDPTRRIGRTRITTVSALLSSLLWMHKDADLGVLLRQFPCWLHDVLSLELPLVLQVSTGNLPLYSPGKCCGKTMDVQLSLLPDPGGWVPIIGLTNKLTRRQISGDPVERLVGQIKKVFMICAMPKHRSLFAIVQKPYSSAATGNVQEPRQQCLIEPELDHDPVLMEAHLQGHLLLYHYYQ